MKLKRRIFVVLLVIMMLSLTVVQAFAENINDLKERQQDIQERMSNTKEELQSTEEEAGKVREQIQQLDKQVTDAAGELQGVTDQLEGLNNNIVKTTEELKEAEENLSTKNDEFNSRLRTMYKNGNVGYIEVLLSASNIGDLLSRNHMLQEVANYDRELISFIKEQMDIIEEKKTELEAQRASVQVVKSEIESRKSELEAATRQKQVFMSRLQEDMDAFEKEYDEMLNDSNSIKTEILNLQAKEEEARKAREREAQAAQAAQAKPASVTESDSSGGSSYTGGQLSWPVPASSRITSYYGYRIHPISKVKKLHTGIDIGAPAGTAIVAAESGTVIQSGWRGGYGNTVMVDHGGGIVTLYAHNSSNTVSAGQQVNRGQTIALIGSTGNSTGPHLHFEVRKNGDHVDPLPWVR